MEDITGAEKRVSPGQKVYWCRTVAVAPLAVYADYGWHTGPLAGGGGKAIYLWFAGLSFRVYTLSSWAA